MTAESDSEHATQIRILKAQRDRATARHKASEAKYDALMSALARAMVVELRAANYIEIHEAPPTRDHTTNNGT
jgi:hypothetical protein